MEAAEARLVTDGLETTGVDDTVTVIASDPEILNFEQNIVVTTPEVASAFTRVM